MPSIEYIEFTSIGDNLYICVSCTLGPSRTSVKRVSVPKLYYSIGEVSQMFDEEQHVLRHWEREFSLLRPQKNRAGNRVYTERDIRILRVLKVLLREERKTIAQVRSILVNGIPPELDTIANDSSIEQRYTQKRQLARLREKLLEEGSVVLSRHDAEFLLATLRRLDELFYQSLT